MNEACVIRGRGKITEVRQMMKVLHIEQPLFVGRWGIPALVSAAGSAEDCPAVFGGYHPNPELRDCIAGAELYRKNCCDGIISIGGGSAMDTAKGIKAYLLAENEEDVLASRLESDRVIPHIAIPATAGTGAEATQYAVAYMNGKKVSLSHRSLLPDGIILDADLLKTLSAYNRRSCAFDALCQGIESWWAKASTEESRIHAGICVRGVLTNLTAYLENDPSAEEKMLEAAYQSGVAIQTTRTTAAHAMSYMLTQWLGLAHGHACMMTLPVLWRFMAKDPSLANLLDEITALIGAGDRGTVPDLFEGMLLETGMYPEKGQDEETLEKLAGSVNPERLGNHPQKLSHEDLKEIYRQAFIPGSTEHQAKCRQLWHDYITA